MTSFQNSAVCHCCNVVTRCHSRSWTWTRSRQYSVSTGSAMPTCRYGTTPRLRNLLTLSKETASIFRASMSLIRLIRSP